MIFGSKRLLGLDIGTSSIKVAEVEVHRNGANLLSFGMTPTPVNSINNGDITNAQSISVAIQSLISELKIKRKNVVTGLWGTAVIIKKITIPKIERKLISEQIKWEAEQYIPFDVNDISLTYHIINPKTAGETYDILLIAAQNELVNTYIGVVSTSGLQLNVLDVSAFALANCFELNYGRLNGDTVAILNIGAGVTNFVIISAGEVVFARDIPVGGLNYTTEIHKELSISMNEAESMKISAAHGSAVPDQVQGAISATNEMVAEEIRNSYDFFSSSNAGLQVSRFFVTGGSSVIPGLIQQIQTGTGLACELFDPMSRIKSKNKKLTADYLQQVSPFSAVALGLALRQKGDV